jgi:para-nitrobenzyl esterase
VNFAKTGNPNGTGLPEWQAFTTTNHDFMYFGGAPRMASILGLSRIEALDSCFARFWKTGSSQ